MRIGEEQPSEEADSRLAIGVAAQIVAVASAMVAGDRGGLPLPIRSGLATLRGVTLPLSALVRLTAREPWMGAALATILTGVVLWIALSKNALLGALFPALALIVVGLWLVLFTIATSLLEEPLAGKKRWAGFAFLVGVPLAFAILAGWPHVPVVREWLDDELNAWVARIAAFLALAATLIALVRVVFRVKPRDEVRKREQKGDRRRKIVSWYRPVLFIGLLTVAGGFIAHRWVAQTQKKDDGWITVANEHEGTILVAVLLGALFVAAVASELVHPRLGRWNAHRNAGGAGLSSNSERVPRRNPVAWWFDLPTAVAEAVAVLSALFLAAVAFFVGWGLG